ncbi:heparan-alpha-glucosaminide N-acetyltransferase domain-containing protein [Brevibacterium otitidis]|uniref:Heparan-alpha-glucosaminide N-acetyltransferase domain-containing protein n=1 Tax=Brevibacterium otitidis TaxID=53364 RepID=A0ABV5WXN4_9MICO|nr:heparan-alpha-glucosaminide N-acetyltransferase domain-containing protein [Brevibacterium otitidis]
MSDTPASPPAARPATASGTAAGMRLLGVDLARSIALLGMMITHIVPLDDPDPTWATLFAGRSSALFAVLAGVSVVLSTRTLLSVSGPRAWLAAASGLWVRGAVIFVLGLLLASLGSSVAVVLANYGLMFIIASFLLRLPRLALGLLAPVWLIATPLLSHALRTGQGLYPSYDVPDVFMLADPGLLLQELAITGYYPVLQWMGFVLLGMCIARLEWTSRSLWKGMLFIGAAVAALALFASSLLLTMGGRAALEAELSAGADPLGSDLETILQVGNYGTTPTGSWWWMIIAGPHSSTPLDLLHSSGVAVAVLAACMLIARGAAVRWLMPFIAAGAMPLTIYTAHVVAVVFTELLLPPLLSLFLHIATALVFATVWRRAVSARGPLEWPVSRLVSTVRKAILAR